MTGVSRRKRVKRNDDRMTERKEEPAPRGQGKPPKAKSGVAEERQARLAAALRENLRRRKVRKPGGKPG